MRKSLLVIIFICATMYSHSPSQVMQASADEKPHQLNNDAYVASENKPLPVMNILAETNQTMSESECVEAGMGVFCECWTGIQFYTWCMDQVAKRHIEAWLKRKPAKQSE